MPMRVHSRSIVFAALAAAGLAAAGCGSSNDPATGSAAAAGDGSKVSAQMFGRAVPFLNGVSQGLTAQAGREGYDFKINWSSVNPQEQLDQVQTLLAQQPKGLFITPLDPKTVEPPLLQAQQNGTTVMTISGILENPDAYTATIGPNFGELGTLKAEAIVKHLGGKGKVAFVNGQRGLSFVEDQRRSAREVLAEAPGIEIVAEEFTPEVTVDQGLNATQNIVTANPDVDAIYFSGDEQAVGGIQALNERGIDQADVFMVGTDGLASGVKAVQGGNLDFTLAECPFQMGVIAMDTMTAALRGDDVPKRVDTPVIPLTPDTIDEIMASPEWETCTGDDA